MVYYLIVLYILLLLAFLTESVYSILQIALVSVLVCNVSQDGSGNCRADRAFSVMEIYSVGGRECHVVYIVCIGLTSSIQSDPTPLDNGIIVTYVFRTRIVTITP